MSKSDVAKPALPQSGGSYLRGDKGGLSKAPAPKPAAPKKGG